MSTLEEAYTLVNLNEANKQLREALEKAAERMKNCTCGAAAGEEDAKGSPPVEGHPDN